jgi:ABC-type multidrug transport system fused ATPase/permease subunit
MASLSIIFAAIPAVIYLAAGLPVTAGTVSIGTLIAFTTLQNGLFRPITGLLNTGVSVISSLALFARIFEYLDLPVEVDEPARPVRIDPAQVTGHVRVEGVSFTYPGADRPALAGGRSWPGDTTGRPSASGTVRPIGIKGLTRSAWSAYQPPARARRRPLSGMIFISRLLRRA